MDNKEMMDALLVKPNCYPEKVSIGNTLEDLQKAVGGYIEVTYPFEEEVGIVLNEEGKLMGLPLNRAVYAEDGTMHDIYAGDFLVVGLTEDDFGSLSPELLEKFEQKFHQPEVFVRMGRGIMAIPLPDDRVKELAEKAEKTMVQDKPHPVRDGDCL